MLPVNIALVDDEESFHKIFNMNFKKRVKKKEIDIFTFINAQGFLDFLEKEHEKITIIILFSDINMPGMDGISMCKIISEKYPKIDIYMSSAYGNVDYKSKADEVGAKDFFVKPIDFKKVEEVIDKKIEELRAS